MPSEQPREVTTMDGEPILYAMSCDRGGQVVVSIPRTATADDLADLADLWPILIRTARRIIERAAEPPAAAPTA